MEKLTYLINPSERKILRTAGDRMPLGLLYIARSLEKQGTNVKVYDLNHQDETLLMYDVLMNNPQTIGVSCLTSPMVNETKRLLKRLKAYSNDGKLLVGGYHPTIMPGDFKDLARVIEGPGEIGEITDLTPNRRLLNSSKYGLSQEGLRTGTAITSRGCPNDCVFCGNLNRKVIYHTMDAVSQDLDELVKQGFNAVYFLDDVFTLNKERAKQIGSLCKDRDLKFRLTTRANYLDRDLIKDLASKGLDIVSMGVESGNNEILKNCGKNQTTEKIQEAVNILTQEGVKSKGFFIIGLPGETETTARQTLDFAKTLKAYGMKTQDFYPLVPFPGTEIWTNPYKFGINIIDFDYTNYLQANRTEPKIVCETKDLSADRINTLLREAKQ